jgi:hypothetical protein
MKTADCPLCNGMYFDQVSQPHEVECPVCKSQETVDWLTLRVLHYQNDMTKTKDFLRSLSDMFDPCAGDSASDINHISEEAREILKNLKT